VALFFEEHAVARDFVIATAALALVAEACVTYLGHLAPGASRAERARNAMASVITTAVPRNRGSTQTVDQGTRRILVVGTLAGVLVAVEVASRVPRARWGSNDWFGVIAGMTIALAGIALRAWAVKTLGRYFQREVVIESGQTIVRSGPYRWLRHPAYSGNLLMFFGLGVVVGSWVGAAAGAIVMLAAHVPRIRVEEHALRAAFGEGFARYANETARLVPGVW
jgi:protein-S-isoprenylcysteine O-methyltransferase Ste14